MAHLSGKSYADFIQEEVFRPLQMRDSFVGPASKTAGVASPYSGLKRIEWNDGDTPASGAAFASVHDLAMFGIFHLGILAQGQERILTDANLQAKRDSSTPCTLRVVLRALTVSTGRRRGRPELLSRSPGVNEAMSLQSQGW